MADRGVFDPEDASAEHRPGLRWIWNEEPTEEGISAALEGFARAGYGWVAVAADPYAGPEYLGTAWMTKLRHAAATARRLGMRLGPVVDHAGCRRGPDGRLRVLSVRTVHREPVGSVTGAIGVYDLENDRRLPEGADLDREARSSHLLVLETRDSPCIDPYRPDVVEDLVRRDLEPYRQVLDEGSEKAFDRILVDLALPSTPVFSWYLAAEFRRDHGYELVDRLHHLFSDSIIASATRVDYCATLTRLFADGYAAALARWARDAGVTPLLILHEDPEAVSPLSHVSLASALPVLGLRSGRLDPARVRHLAGAARQGGARALVDLHGRGRHSAGFAELRAASELAAVHGADEYLDHIAATLAGPIQAAGAPVAGEHAAAWPFHRLLTDSRSRVFGSLRHGRSEARLLVLSCETSLWMCRWDAEELRRRREDHAALVSELVDRRIDFDLGDETLLGRLGAVRAEGLLVGEGGPYDTVLVPASCRNLLRRTADILADFVAAGGTLVLGGDVPGYLDGRPSDALEQLAGAHPELVRQPTEGVRGVLDLVEWRHPPLIHLRAGGAGFYHRSRRLEDGSVVHFLVNASGRDWDGTVEFAGARMVRLDGIAGRMETCAVERIGEDRVAARLEVPGGGSALWYDGPGSANPPVDARTVETAVELSLLSVEPALANRLRVDRCDLSYGGVKHENLRPEDARLRLFRGMGVDLPIRAGSPIRRRDESFVLTYRFSCSRPLAERTGEPGDLGLAVERPWLYRIRVNGRDVHTGDSQPFRLDPSIRVLAAGHLVAPGDNTVELVGESFSTEMEPAPIYLVGDFHASADPVPAVDLPGQPALGDLTGQGYPHYDGSVRYLFRATIPEEAPGGFEIAVDNMHGVLAVVQVDGKARGLLCYPPHRAVIPGPVGPGSQIIGIELVGDPGGILGENGRKLGLFSPPTVRLCRRR